MSESSIDMYKAKAGSTALMENPEQYGSNAR